MTPRQSVPDSSLTQPPAARRSKWTHYLILVRTFAAFGLLATFISCFASISWIADLFAQFKIQWAIGLIGVSCLLLIARQWLWIGICVIGILINGIPVWPYLITNAQIQVVDVATHQSARQADATILRLLSLNVLTSNRSYGQVIRLIEREQPDFVVLMEIDSNWEKALHSVRQTHPFVKFQTREDNFGIAFLSRHPWSHIGVFHSRTLQLPSIDVRFEYDSAGTKSLTRDLRIIATHPIPPISSENWSARNEQLAKVSERFDSDSTNIMVGDLNLTPWSPHFSRILNQGRLADSACGFGMTPTWHLDPT